MPTTRFPERGDVIWLSLDPRVGHEQAGSEAYWTSCQKLPDLTIIKSELWSTGGPDEVE